MPFTKDRSVRVAQRWVEFKDYPSHNFVTTLGGAVTLCVRTRTGESVKDYKTLIKQQKNATSNMSGTFDTLDLTSAHRTFKHRFLNFGQITPDPTDVYEVKQIGVLGPNYAFQNPTIGLGVASNRATIAFLKNARKVQSEFSSPIFLGELKETLQMIRRPAQGLRNLLGNYLNGVKKAKKKSPKEWKKNLSSLWLEGTFGWKPLASDIQDGYKAYANLVSQHDNEQRLVSGYGIEEQEVPAGTFMNQPMFFGSGGFTPGYVNKITKDKAVVKITGVVVRRVDATLRDKLARVGFNAEEFVPTVWELLPWSFLIDYFSNIGDVLEANAFNRADLGWVNNTTIAFRTSSIYYWSSVDIVKKSDSAKYFVSFEGEPGLVIQQRRIVNRIASVSVGVPSLSLELPGRPAQFANMLALFAQANSIHPQHRRSR